MTDPDFWNNKEAAQRDVELVSELRGKLSPFLDLESRAADLEILKDLTRGEPPENQAQAIAEVRAEYDAILCAIWKNSSCINCSPASSTRARPS